MYAGVCCVFAVHLCKSAFLMLFRSAKLVMFSAISEEEYHLVTWCFCLSYPNHLCWCLLSAINLLQQFRMKLQRKSPSWNLSHLMEIGKNEFFSTMKIKLNWIVLVHYYYIFYLRIETWVSHTNFFMSHDQIRRF